MSEKWTERKIRWQALAVVICGMAVIAAVLYWGQERDMRLLEERRGVLRDAQLVLQSERSDKLRELNLVDTPEYLADRARENGYLLPGEIRFEITNLDELRENGGEAEAEIAEEGL